MTNVTATLSCYACNDTWFRDLTDFEIQGYISMHPELEDRILAGQITDVDLGEVLCDGCEDYYQDEAELAQAWDDHYQALDEDEAAANV